MKKLSIIAVTLLIAGMAIFTTGCYGKFALTKKVHTWNGSLGNKYVEEAVFLAFCIIPVYEVSAFVDAVILNLVEFWTGSNPLALKEGINKAHLNGQDLTINLKKNKATIYDSNSKLLGEINYNEATKTWHSTINGHISKLMTIENENIKLYTQTGKELNVSKNELHAKSTIEKYNEFTAMK